MAFDTSLRDAAVQRQRQKWEAERLRVLACLDGALGETGLDEAYVFGSVIRPGGFGDESDVDIAVPGPFWDVARVASKLSRRVGREVHVVELDSSRVADVARRDGRRWTLQS